MSVLTVLALPVSPGLSVAGLRNYTVRRKKCLNDLSVAEWSSKSSEGSNIHIRKYSSFVHVLTESKYYKNVVKFYICRTAVDKM